MNTSEVKTAIEIQEDKDRAIATAIYSHVKGIKEIKGTEITDPVDLYCELENGRKFYTEIKEMKGDYPNFLLKVGKYRRMRDFTPVGYGLYYMVFNNGKAYIFNILKIKWENVKVIMLR